MKILAIETSCDETAAAVVENGTKILSNVVASSKAMYEKYGGIVPEIAAREQLKCIIPVITEALTQTHRYSTSTDYQHIPPQNQDDINTPVLHSTGVYPSTQLRHIIEHEVDAIAVTVGPGLIGSLLVGVETAKTIAFVTGKPIIPVNHVIAHMYANFVDSSFVIPGLTRNPSSALTGSRLRGRDDKKKIQFPVISLVVSGGHTELYLMKSVKDLTWLGGTLDDAAGECFDKTARLLGFGHGGGVAIERAASRHSGKRVSERVQNPKEMLDKTSMTLPRPMFDDETLNFSFSGLKTAVMREWKKFSYPVIPAQAGIQSGMTYINEELVNMFAYEIQEAISDVLVPKTIRAAKQYGARSILLSGGVAANSRLREKFLTKLQTNDAAKLSFYAPSAPLCTDNAVMIASCAYYRREPVDWHDVTAQSDLNIEV